VCKSPVTTVIAQFNYYIIAKLLLVTLDFKNGLDTYDSVL